MNHWNIAAVGLVVLNRELGCLDPNLANDSEPMQLIQSANSIFESLNNTEAGADMWSFFPTTSYRKLRANHQIFLEYVFQCFFFYNFYIIACVCT